MRATSTEYESYKKRYDWEVNHMRSSNQFLTEMYTEDEFNDIYKNIKNNRQDLDRTRIIQYIVIRQKRYINLY